MRIEFTGLSVSPELWLQRSGVATDADVPVLGAGATIRSGRLALAG